MGNEIARLIRAAQTHVAQSTHKIAAAAHAPGAKRDELQRKADEEQRALLELQQRLKQLEQGMSQASMDLLGKILFGDDSGAVSRDPSGSKRLVRRFP